MNYIDKVQSFSNYLEANIRDVIDIPLALEKLNISKFHFYRLFKAIIGLSINDYIKQRKIYLSAIEMLNSNYSVLELAISYGFQSHEVFYRNFKKYTGMTPKSWRSNPKMSLLKRFTKFNIDSIKLDIKSSRGKVIIEDNVTKIDQMTLIGIESRVKDEEPELIQGRIDNFLKEADSINNVESEVLYRVIHSLDFSKKPITYKEFIGVPVKKITNIPKGMKSLKLPGGKFLTIEHNGKVFGESSSIIDTYDYIYRFKIALSNYELNRDYAFEKYGEKFINPNSKESIVEISLGIM